MTCLHRHVSYLQHHRVTRVPNTRKSRMLTKECSRCGAVLPVSWPLGDATSNDRIPADEAALAVDIADLCILWEPGMEREQRIAKAVAWWSGYRDGAARLVAVIGR